MFFFFLLSLLFAFLPPKVFAKYDPLTVPNNRYGIHVADPNDIPATAELVNSTGGDWGYVTVVIQDNDQDPGKWQGIFNTMRRLHLVPIVRLATHAKGDYWLRPSPESADTWAAFLNTLTWPVENRYVVVFNEPNHAKEWGNTIDPEGYAVVLANFAAKLRATSPDFFILPAGLDVSAGNTRDTLDAAMYLRRMVESQPGVLDLLDGWTSHSYPNPGFSGSPYAYGRGTLRSYLWEREYLRQLGFTKNLPVFIAETGWIHSNGIAFNPRLLSPEQVASNMLAAGQTIWQDPAIAAITPFVYNYQGGPFDHFSFTLLGANGFYSHYYTYQAISKIAGEPRQHEQFELASELPQTLVAGSRYTLTFDVKNTGQSILDSTEGYTPSFTFTSATSDPSATYDTFDTSDASATSVFFASLPRLEPGQKGTLTVSFEPPGKPGTYEAQLSFSRRGTVIPVKNQKVTVIPPPSLTVRVSLGFKRRADSANAKVLVYDHETLLNEFSPAAVANGVIEIPGVTNIIPGRPYRIVVVVPYYLPRQTTAVFTDTGAKVSMKRFLPLDFDLDGTLGYGDLTALLQLAPNRALELLFGS